MKHERSCIVCSTKYSYCNNCWEDRLLPLWMNSFHDENCKNIFQICTDMNMKLISKEEAKALLSKCDLSNRAKFRADVQRDLKSVFGEGKPIAEEQPKKKEIAKSNSDMK